MPSPSQDLLQVSSRACLEQLKPDWLRLANLFKLLNHATRGSIAAGALSGSPRIRRSAGLGSGLLRCLSHRRNLYSVASIKAASRAIKGELLLTLLRA